MMLNFSSTKIELRRRFRANAKSFISSILRNKRMFADTKETGCYLDLGCGRNISPGFCNLDYYWLPGVDVCWDVTKPLPFPDGYVSGIFSEHMIEHIPFDAALGLLKECRRVLQLG